jgi:hypothetical protein
VSVIIVFLDLLGEMKKLIALFALLTLLGCDSGERLSHSNIDEWEKSDNPSIAAVDYYCNERLLDTKAKSCFAVSDLPKDWKHFGNAVFYLYQNRPDLFLVELGKIDNHESVWYQAGKLSEALFMNNMKNARLYLNWFSNHKATNVEDIFVLESRSQYLLDFSGNFEGLKKLLSQIPRKTVVSSDGLVIKQNYVYIRDNDQRSAIKLLNEHKNTHTKEDYNYVAMRYYYETNDWKAAKKLYSKNDYSSTKYTYGLLRTLNGYVDDEHLLIAALKELGCGMDIVLPTIFTLLYENKSNVVNKIKDACLTMDEDFFKNYWAESADYHTLQALFFRGIKNEPMALWHINKAISFSPKSYWANKVKSSLCGDDTDCRRETDEVIYLYDY